MSVPRFSPKGPTVQPDPQARRTLRLLANSAASLMVLPLVGTAIVLISGPLWSEPAIHFQVGLIVYATVMPLKMLTLCVMHVMKYRSTPPIHRPAGVVVSVVLFAVIGWVITLLTVFLLFMAWSLSSMS